MCFKKHTLFKLRRLPALVFLIMLSSSVCGKVFWFRPGAMSDSFTEGNPKRNEIYSSNVSINSGAGRLRVIACEEFLGSVKNWLESSFRDEATASHVVEGDGMVAGVFERGGKVARVVALDLGVYAQTIVFWIEQDAAEYKKSQTPPDVSSVQSFPVFPGSRLTLSVTDDDRGVELALFDVSSEVNETVSFYRTSLTGAGWTLLSNTEKSLHSVSGMNVFSKDGDIRCVLVKEGSRPGKSLITLLHKGLDIR